MTSTQTTFSSLDSIILLKHDLCLNHSLIAAPDRSLIHRPASPATACALAPSAYSEVAINLSGSLPNLVLLIMLTRSDTVALEAYLGSDSA